MKRSAPRIVGLNSVAEAGFPDVVCPVVFLHGCDLRCAYCLNSSIVGVPSQDIKSVDEVLQFMSDHDEKNVFISGGEAMLDPHFDDLVTAFRSKNIAVRLATNGSNPEKLESLIMSGKLSFVALDLKFDIFSHLKSGIEEHLGISRWNLPTYAKHVSQSMYALLRHTKLIGFSFEFRTTLYPPLIDDKAIRSIGQNLHPKATWVLQQYRNADGCGFGGKLVAPYGNEAVNELLKIAKENVSNVHLRHP